MTPLDFVSDFANGYNEPAGAIQGALKKPLTITDGAKEYEVLSYYFNSDTGQMVIDIQTLSEEV